MISSLAVMVNITNHRVQDNDISDGQKVHQFMEKHRFLNRSDMVCLQHNTYELFEELESSIGTIAYGWTAMELSFK